MDEFVMEMSRSYLFLCKVIFPAKFFFCILEKRILAEKIYFAKEVFPQEFTCFFRINLEMEHARKYDRKQTRKLPASRKNQAMKLFH
jgi:hypothetical protein